MVGLKAVAMDGGGSCCFAAASGAGMCVDSSANLRSRSATASCGDFLVVTAAGLAADSSALEAVGAGLDIIIVAAKLKQEFKLSRVFKGRGLRSRYRNDLGWVFVVVQRETVRTLEPSLAGISEVVQPLVTSTVHQKETSVSLTLPEARLLIFLTQ
jgi:hypothetical protein